MARPPLEIDMQKLAALMRMKPTAEDCAAFFKCSVDTIERRIRDESGLSFAEFREQNMVHTRMTLIRTALHKAEKGDNVMLIFALKNLCGWKDKQEIEHSGKMGFENLTKEELEARAVELAKQIVSGDGSGDA